MWVAVFVAILCISSSEASYGVCVLHWVSANVSCFGLLRHQKQPFVARPQTEINSNQFPSKQTHNGAIICRSMYVSSELAFYVSIHVFHNPYPTAFPYGNGMVLHFYQQQESSTTKTVHKVINKGLKTYV